MFRVDSSAVLLHDKEKILNMKHDRPVMFVFLCACINMAICSVWRRVEGMQVKLTRLALVIPHQSDVPTAKRMKHRMMSQLRKRDCWWA